MTKIIHFFSFCTTVPEITPFYKGMQKILKSYLTNREISIQPNKINLNYSMKHRCRTFQSYTRLKIWQKRKKIISAK